MAAGLAPGAGTGVSAGSAGVAGAVAGETAAGEVAVCALALSGAIVANGRPSPREQTVETTVDLQIPEIMFCTMRPFTNYLKSDHMPLWGQPPVEARKYSGVIRVHCLGQAPEERLYHAYHLKCSTPGLLVG